MRRVGLGLGIVGLLASACGTGERTAASEAADTSATCSPEQQFDRFTHMIEQPIVPPRMFGGLDLAGGDSWSGLTLDSAEQTLCGSNPIAEVGEDKNPTLVMAGWGVAPSYQVVVEYDKNTKKVDFFQLNSGYKGTLDFASRPTALGDPSKPNPFGQHHYSIGVDHPVLRDGQPWLFDWNVANGWDQQATEMFDALMFTFAPELPSTQNSCIKAQTCLARVVDGNTAIFGARPLGIYMHVADVTAPQPAPSTPDYIYGFAFKQTPASGADMLLKLDAAGPVATASNLGDHASNCVMTLGMPFQSFLGDCVQVVSDPSRNEMLRNKVLGNAQRSITTSGATATGTWLLDVAGVRPSFDSQRFDEREPAATSRATEIVLDVRSSGKVLNEYATDGSTFTFAATGAVYREYARTVQDFLHAQMDPTLPRFPIGASECLLPAGADPKGGWQPARGCTGMEQFLTPADPSTTNDEGVKRVSVGGSQARALGIQTVLKPGFPIAMFCADPETMNLCGWDPGTAGHQGAIFAATHEQVRTVLGGGDDAKIPADARDPATYVRFFAKALVKYLRAAPQSPTDLGSSSFDGLTPADGDITLEGSGVATLKYLNKLELKLDVLAANIQRVTFR
jgi:hypothetical protein